MVCGPLARAGRARRGGKFGIVMQRIGVADGARERTGRAPARARAERKSARAAGCGSFLLPQSGKAGKGTRQLRPKPRPKPRSKPPPTARHARQAGKIRRQARHPRGQTSGRKTSRRKTSRRKTSPPRAFPREARPAFSRRASPFLPGSACRRQSPSCCARPAIGPRFAPLIAFIMSAMPRCILSSRLMSSGLVPEPSAMRRLRLAFSTRGCAAPSASSNR